jgi:hypothetical protein
VHVGARRVQQPHGLRAEAALRRRRRALHEEHDRVRVHELPAREYTARAERKGESEAVAASGERRRLTLSMRAWMADASGGAADAAAAAGLRGCGKKSAWLSLSGGATTFENAREADVAATERSASGPRRASEHAARPIRSAIAVEARGSCLFLTDTTRAVAFF